MGHMEVHINDVKMASDLWNPKNDYVSLDPIVDVIWPAPLDKNVLSLPNS